MKIEAARIATMAAFQAGFTGATAVPVQLPNQKWAQPQTGSWGRVNMIPGSRESAAIGRSLDRQTCLLELQLFQPEETGTATIYKAAELFANVFDDLQLTPEAGLLIEFDTVGIIQGGTQAGFHQIIASISFRIDKAR